MRHLFAVSTLIGLVSVVSGCGLVNLNVPGLSSSSRSGPMSNEELQAKLDADRQQKVAGLVSEKDLNAKWCKVLGERAESLRGELSAAEKLADTRAALAALSRVRLAALELQAGVQADFGAEYQQMAQTADKAGVGGPSGSWGYGTNGNVSSLPPNSVVVGAAVSGTSRLLATSTPSPRDPKHGINANDASAALWPKGGPCERPAAVAAQLAQLTSNLDALEQRPPARDLEKDHPASSTPPAKVGDLVLAQGTLVSLGAVSVSDRNIGQLIINKNCRSTGVFSHWDSNGHARYLENCDYGGGIEYRRRISFANLSKHLPQGVKLAVGDQVTVRGKVTAYAKTEKKQGQVTVVTQSYDVDTSFVVLHAHDLKIDYEW